MARSQFPLYELVALLDQGANLLNPENRGGEVKARLQNDDLRLIFVMFQVVAQQRKDALGAPCHGFRDRDIGDDPAIDQVQSLVLHGRQIRRQRDAGQQGRQQLSFIEVDRLAGSVDSNTEISRSAR